MRKMVLAAVAATTLSGASHAATVYDFSLTGAQTASFTLPSNASRFIGGGPLYEGILGTYNGLTLVSDVQLANNTNGEGGLNVSGNTSAAFYLVYTTGPVLYSVTDMFAYQPVPGSYVLQNTAETRTPGQLGPSNLTITARFVPDPVAEVPEPATWALMLAGFGAIGYGLRRRQTVISFA